MTKKQIIILSSTIIIFILIDIFLACYFNKIYKTNPNMKAKSVAIEEFIPYSDDTKAVYDKEYIKIKFENGAPVIDCAAALYPVESALVNSIYDSSDVKFQDNDYSKDSKIQMNNTIGCWKRLADGQDDVILVTNPSSEQQKYINEKNMDIEMVPIGLEAMVFIVNNNNPVDDLTFDNIKDIYTGKILNWKELGGLNKNIVPLQRNEGSGSQTMFLKVMGDIKPVNSAPLSGSAIGFSFRYYVEALANQGSVKMLKINGVYPSKENIINKTYPIASTFFAVYDKNSEKINDIRKVIDFILSDDGQELIENNGYVRLENK